jgi:hypothetical protein
MFSTSYILHYARPQIVVSAFFIKPIKIVLKYRLSEKNTQNNVWHTHVWSHTPTNIYQHTHTNKYIPTHTRVVTHTNKYIPTHTRVVTHTNKYIPTHTQPNLLLYLHCMLTFLSLYQLLPCFSSTKEKSKNWFVLKQLHLLQIHKNVNYLK